MANPQGLMVATMPVAKAYRTMGLTNRFRPGRSR